MSTVDTEELDDKVRQIYRQVAEHPRAASTSRWAGRWPSGSDTHPSCSMPSHPARSNPSPVWATFSTSPPSAPGARARPG